MRIKILIILFISCALLNATKTYAQQDSMHLSLYHTPLIKINNTKWDKFKSSKFYQTTYISIPLIAGGLMLKNESKPFRTLRNDYIPNFHYKYDDILQYAPAIAMVGMKIGGIKSLCCSIDGNKCKCNKIYGKSTTP